jgi:transglutaminase-like putative cysteine protease
MKLAIFIYTFFVLMIASNTSVFANDSIIIDKTQINNGLVSVQYKNQIKQPIKVQVQKADVKYNYTIRDNDKTNFPLQMGPGNYTITVLENVVNQTYKVVSSDSFDVNNISDSAVYTQSIQLVDFDSSMKSIADLKALTVTATSDRQKLDAIYNYVTANISYDFDKLKALPQDYIPVIDEVYASKEGICYDYASLFASALRVVNIPTRLIMGYSQDIEGYHALNQVFLDGQWMTIDTTYDAQAKTYNVKYDQAKDSARFTVVKTY